VSYTQFAQKMLLALYRESDGDTSQQVDFDALPQKYGIPVEKSFWITNLTTEWPQQGFAHFRDGGTGRQNVVVINLAGVRNAEAGPQDLLAPISVMESSFGPNDAVLRPVPELHSEAIDSSSWTGLPSNFQLTQDIQAKLVRDLDSAEAALTTLTVSQDERSQARAYIIAIRVLAEAPEPQTDLIWEMLTRANQISGIASLFVSIMALFVTVAH
jgi:hypothetical protein